MHIVVEQRTIDFIMIKISSDIKLPPLSNIHSTADFQSPGSCRSCIGINPIQDRVVIHAIDPADYILDTLIVNSYKDAAFFKFFHDPKFRKINKLR